MELQHKFMSDKLFNLILKADRKLRTQMFDRSERSLWWLVWPWIFNSRTYCSIITLNLAARIEDSWNIEFLDAWSPYGLSIVIQATCIMGTMTGFAGFASLPVFIILLGCLQPQKRITWSPFPHDSRLRRSPVAPIGQQLEEL